MLTTLRRAVACLLTAVAITVAPAAAPAAPRPALPTDPPMRILVMGDSITTACIDGGSYCRKLDELLTQAGVPHQFLVAAVGGVDCTYWANRIDATLAQYNPDMLLLSCGTNQAGGNAAQLDAMGQAWRTILEHTYTVRPTNRVRIGISWIQYSDPFLAPGWLVPNEANINDQIFRDRRYYEPAWAPTLAGTADFQMIPSEARYLTGDDGPPGQTGIHPTAAGYDAMGVIWYRALRERMGWPDVVAEPCGMTGHRIGYARRIPAC